MKKIVEQMDQLARYPKFVMLAGLWLSVFLLLGGFSFYVWSYHYDIALLKTAEGFARMAVSVMGISIFFSLISNYVLMRRSG